jgi:hypothetical protein
MSGWSDFFMTPEFWTGAFVSGLLSSGLTLVGTRASDKRKFAQEVSVLDRKETREDTTRAERIAREDQARAEQFAREDVARAEHIAREDKMRRDENLYTAASEFTETCSGILMNAIDTKRVFNAIRDMFFDSVGAVDPRAEEKFDRATQVTEDTKRIAVPFNKLRLVAPNNVLEAATRLNASILAVLRTTTEPFAAPVTLKAAGVELDNFINEFRTEVGQGAYTESTAQRETIGFLQNLKAQVDDYLKDAQRDMRAAGFRSTPWDDLGRSTG